MKYILTGYPPTYEEGERGKSSGTRIELKHNGSYLFIKWIANTPSYNQTNGRGWPNDGCLFWNYDAPRYQNGMILIRPFTDSPYMEYIQLYVNPMGGIFFVLIQDLTCMQTELLRYLCFISMHYLCAHRILYF